MKRLGRAARRRIDRAVEKILGADDCTLCHRPLANGDMTFSGATAAGTAAVVGECCAARLVHVTGIGVFLSRTDPLGGILVDTMKCAGFAGRPFMLSLADSAWKRSDAAWFAANPDRSHRLRPMAPGEARTLLRDPTEVPPMPPRHAMWVIVRQIEPGRRVKLGFIRSHDCPIPDLEPLVHALFDLAANGWAGEVLSTTAVAELAERHARAAVHQGGTH